MTISLDNLTAKAIAMIWSGVGGYALFGWINSDGQEMHLSQFEMDNHNLIKVNADDDFADVIKGYKCRNRRDNWDDLSASFMGVVNRSEEREVGRYRWLCSGKSNIKFNFKIGGNSGLDPNDITKIQNKILVKKWNSEKNSLNDTIDEMSIICDTYKNQKITKDNRNNVFLDNYLRYCIRNPFR